MALNLQSNIASLEAGRAVNRNQSSLMGSFNKLSSGYRVNSAADDAAGLAISESMKSQVRSFVVAERNAADGISMAQTAEGSLGEIHDILGRMRELAMQSSNGSLQGSDRAKIAQEFDQLQTEIGRIKSASSFNGVGLLDGSAGSAGSVAFQVGLAQATSDTIAVSFANVNLSTVSGGGVSVTTQTAAQAALSEIDAGIGTVSSSRAVLGAAINRLQVATNNIQTMRLNVSAANSRIRDVDVAAESASMAKSQVLTQASISILAQANQLPQLAFGLIGR